MLRPTEHYYADMKSCPFFKEYTQSTFLVDCISEISFHGGQCLKYIKVDYKGFNIIHLRHYGAAMSINVNLLKFYLQTILSKINKRSIKKQQISQFPMSADRAYLLVMGFISTWFMLKLAQYDSNYRSKNGRKILSFFLDFESGMTTHVSPQVKSIHNQQILP